MREVQDSIRDTTGKTSVKAVLAAANKTLGEVHAGKHGNRTRKSRQEAGTLASPRGPRIGGRRPGLGLAFRDGASVIAVLCPSGLGASRPALALSGQLPGAGYRGYKLVPIQVANARHWSALLGYLSPAP